MKSSSASYTSIPGASSLGPTKSPFGYLSTAAEYFESSQHNRNNQMFSMSIKEIEMESVKGESIRLKTRMATGCASAAALLLLVAAGCGKTQDPNRLPVFRASGKVTFQGKAPAGALVVLHPKVSTPENQAVRPRAYVKEDGSFELSSYESNDGAPAGDYAVVLVWPKPVKSPSGELSAGPNVLPPKYSRPESSPEVVKIAEGANQLNPIIVK
jgi:hypothetical protein